MKTINITMRAGITGLLVFLIILIAPGLLVLPITLVFGWCFSLARMVRALHPDASHIGLMAIALVSLVAGTHQFMRWLHFRIWNSTEKTLSPGWLLKWSLCLLGMLFCTLVASASGLLTTHQLFWFSQSSDPLFANARRGRFSLVTQASRLQQSAAEWNWDTGKTQAAFWKGATDVDGQSVLEEFQPVWIEQDQHRLRAVVLIPRKPLVRSWSRIAVLRPGEKFAMFGLDQLPRVLKSFGLGEESDQALSP